MVKTPVLVKVTLVYFMTLSIIRGQLEWGWRATNNILFVVVALKQMRESQDKMHFW